MKFDRVVGTAVAGNVSEVTAAVEHYFGSAYGKHAGTNRRCPLCRVMRAEEKERRRLENARAHRRQLRGGR